MVRQRRCDRHNPSLQGLSRQHPFWQSSEHFPRDGAPTLTWSAPSRQCVRVDHECIKAGWPSELVGGDLDVIPEDIADPEWTNDPAMKAFLSFMDKYYPDGDKDDGNAALGYAAAETLFHVLSQCGDDLSRENIMKQSASLQAYHNPIVLPGITISTGSTDFHPIKKMRLVQFDGAAWRSIGDVFEDAFIGGTGQANP
jgi:hypothetical protein